MSLGSFDVNGTTYRVIDRKAWEGNVAGGVIPGTGTAWAYVVQSESGPLWAFIVQYPFILGSPISPDNIGRDLEMIQRAIETDPEGVHQRAPRQYEINTKQPPYDSILNAWQ